ncbi:MAG: helicase C-terminal domain-containing protein [Cyanobacteria bacterium J06638_22]
MCHNELQLFIREVSVIEVEVHQQLRAFLRQQGEPYWHHHLTMARLVARGLRLKRSTLIQAGASSGYHGHYRLSYLMPALLWQEPTVLVVPEPLQQRLLMVEIPRLREWLLSPKPIRTGDRFPESGFNGLLLTTPEAWLSDRLQQAGRFPDEIPTILDGVEDLETWVRDLTTIHLLPEHWDTLMLAYPNQVEQIRDVRVRLTHGIFQHPPNPYNCYVLDAEQRSLLHQLVAQCHEVATVGTANLPTPWNVWEERLQSEDFLNWATINRDQGYFALHSNVVELAPLLTPVWEKQSVVMIGGAVDSERMAPTFRQQVGLDDAACIQFHPDRHQEFVQLYLPDGLPMPNTPQFQPMVMRELRALLSTNTARQGLTVILVNDVPLRAQLAAELAAEYGARVQMEKTCLDDMGILVAGWEFWRSHQTLLPTPTLLVIPTLPIPSLEDPRVEGRVAYYKRHRQDWFRLYLLPTALNELQRAIAPLRDNRGVVALLDNRVNHRSYGQQVLEALEPMAQINYLDASLFSTPDFSAVD